MPDIRSDRESAETSGLFGKLAGVRVEADGSRVGETGTGTTNDPRRAPRSPGFLSTGSDSPVSSDSSTSRPSSRRHLTVDDESVAA